MTFFRPGALYLLLILVPVLIFLMRNLLHAKTMEYPGIMMFRKSRQEHSDYFRVIKEILKVLLVLMTIASAIFYAAGPHVKSGNYETILICIDSTPLCPLKGEQLLAIADSILKDTPAGNIVYMSNGKIIDVQRETVFRNRYMQKSQFIEQALRYRLDKGNLSVKTVLISDRDIVPFEGAEFIHIDNSDRLLLIQPSDRLCIYSHKDTLIDIRLYYKDMLSYRNTQQLKQGYNFVDAGNIIYDSIECGDTLSLDEDYTLGSMTFNKGTSNEFIISAMNAMGCAESDSGVLITEHYTGSRGIVFASGSMNFSQRKGRLTGGELADILNAGPALEFSALSDVPGNALVYTETGQRVVTYDKGSYFVAVPADTTYSNMVLLPQFIPFLSRLMVLSGEAESKTPAGQFEYRSSLLVHSNGFEGDDAQKMLNIKNYFIIGAILCVLLLALLVFL